MPRIEQYQKYMNFTEIVPISALEGLNVDHFIDVLKHIYLKVQNTIRMINLRSPEQFVVSEIIREKILHLTSEEIPHAIGVNVDRMIKKMTSVLELKLLFMLRETHKKVLLSVKAAKTKRSR